MYALGIIISLVLIFGFGCALYILPDGPDMPWYNAVVLMTNVVGLAESIILLSMCIYLDLNKNY
jgi:hypothetical protein